MATTAPLAGSRRHARVKRLLRKVGPCIGGAAGSRERRAFWLFASIIPLANLAGAIDVFVFLWFILPLPDVSNHAHVQEVNVIAFAVTMVITFAICGTVSNRLSAPVAAWLDSSEPADEAMVRYVLRQPLYQSGISVGAWTAGALTFGILDSFYSPALGALLFVGILMGGVTTCGLMYLLTERALRPITVRALSGGAAPRDPALPGVDARVLISFAVTTVGPLLGMATLGIVLLSGTHVSTSRLALSILVLALVALTSGILSMKLVARSLAEPLRSVRHALARVERGDLDTDVRVSDGSEVGVLQAGFNSMVAGLRERDQLRDLFGRHVGEHVASAALQNGTQLGGEQRQAAVVFVDVVGSTTLALERSPDEVVSLLNRFFGIVVEVMHEHHGWINKFEGDGALCVFGAPGRLDDPAGCALAAARELDARLRADLPELPAGIGVSAGRVVAGNVGAAERYEYTLIGDPVNEASRLTQLAKGTPARVLASAETLAVARQTERERWQPDGQATLRGRPHPTALVVPV